MCSCICIAAKGIIFNTPFRELWGIYEKVEYNFPMYNFRRNNFYLKYFFLNATVLNIFEKKKLIWDLTLYHKEALPRFHVAFSLKLGGSIRTISAKFQLIIRKCFQCFLFVQTINFPDTFFSNLVTWRFHFHLISLIRAEYITSSIRHFWRQFSRANSRLRNFLHYWMRRRTETLPST